MYIELFNKEFPDAKRDKPHSVICVTSDSMTVSVKLVESKETRSLMCRGDQTLSEFKSDILRVLSLDSEPWQLRLITNGRELTENDATLDALKVQNGQQINVVRRTLGMRPSSVSMSTLHGEDDALPSPAKLLSREYFPKLYSLLAVDASVSHKVCLLYSDCSTKK